MMKVTGDKEQSAAKRTQQGYEEAEMRVCVCVCVSMSDSGVLGHLDCPYPPLLGVHLSPPHTLLYSFPSALPNPPFHFLTSSPIPHSPKPLHPSLSLSPYVHFRVDPGSIPPRGPPGTFPIRPQY